MLARGKDARLRVNRLIAERGDGAAIEAPGAGNVILVGEAHANLINQSRTDANFVGVLGRGSRVRFATPPFIERSNGARCGPCGVAAP